MEHILRGVVRGTDMKNPQNRHGLHWIRKIENGIYTVQEYREGKVFKCTGYRKIEMTENGERIYIRVIDDRVMTKW